MLSLKNMEWYAIILTTSWVGSDQGREGRAGKAQNMKSVRYSNQEILVLQLER